MPPKAAASNKESVDDAVSRLIANAENPSEADFKILLNAAKSDDPQKLLAAANYIPSYYNKFPKQQKASLNAILELAKSDDSSVRTYAVRNLKNFYEIDKQQVGDAIINSLGDEVESISKYASEFIERQLKDDEFKTRFFNSLPNVNTLGQVRMVSIIRDNITFTEENVDQLLEVLKVSFKSCLVEGLSLFGKNRKLIDDEKFQPIVDELFQRLDTSLQSNFKDVSEELLIPIFKFTRALGNDATTRLLGIIADRVIPKFDELTTSKQIEVIRKIANVANYADSDKLLVEIYNNIFLKFPTENNGKLNFSIIEATLFAFISLARKFNNTASKLIGTTLCYTGQPGEVDETNEDEEKQAAFRKRIEYLSSIAPDFVDTYDAEIQKYRNQETKNDTERKEQSEHIQEALVAKRTGNNIRHLTRILLSNNPLNGKLPQAPSWKKKLRNDRKFSSNRRSQRTGGRRGDRFNRNNDRNGNRSRNGGRFNNGNNRQRRGRFSNSNRR